jgi:hypothetical protein
MPMGNAFDLTLVHRIAGMAAAAARRWDEAQDHFEHARRQVVELPNRLDHPHVLHWYAKMLLDRGKADDHERAQTMLVEALEEYRASGMPLHSVMVEVLLA